MFLRSVCKVAMTRLGNFRRRREETIVRNSGWRADPFGVHEWRYFAADGRPTKLVRDGWQESYDEPPNDGALTYKFGQPVEPSGAPSPTLSNERELDPTFWDGNDVVPPAVVAVAAPVVAESRRAVVAQTPAPPRPQPKTVPVEDVVLRRCPGCRDTFLVSTRATTLHCPACEKSMFFVECDHCGDTALAHTEIGDKWTCPTCQSVQLAVLHFTDAAGRTSARAS
jgi:hypothetical protein